jgi:hypothetical protein
VIAEKIDVVALSERVMSTRLALEAAIQVRRAAQAEVSRLEIEERSRRLDFDNARSALMDAAGGTVEQDWFR